MKLESKAYKTIIKGYTEYLETLNFAKSTIYDFPRFVAFFLEHLEQKNCSTLQQITNEIIQAYFKELEQRPHKRKPNETLSTSYLNNNFLAIDKFLEYLHQMGLETAPSPTKYQVEHYRKKELQILTIQDVTELFEAVKLTYWELNFAKRESRQQLLKLTLNLCYGLGLRRSEALNIKLKDVDFDQK